jgi:hypothetical protein
MGTNHFGISAGIRAMVNMSQGQWIFSLLSFSHWSFVTLPLPLPQSQMTLIKVLCPKVIIY